MRPDEAPLVDPQARVIDYLRMSVTDRCNYRCTYCVPDDGAAHVERADMLSFEEIVALVRVFVALGVRRLRLTGGEPTVRRDLSALVRRCARSPGSRSSRCRPTGTGWPSWRRRCGGRRRSPQRQPRHARPREVRAHHPARRSGARLRRARGGARGRLRVDQAQHRRHQGLQRRRDRRALRASPGSAACAALHRGDADGGRADLRAWELPAGGPRSARTSRPHRPAGAASSTTAEATRAARGPARYYRLAATSDVGATPARRFGIISPMTEHFCDDLQPRCACRRRARCTPASATTTRSICADRCAAPASRRSSRRSAARSAKSATDTSSSCSGSAVRARRWSRSADDRRAR